MNTKTNIRVTRACVTLAFVLSLITAGCGGGGEGGDSSAPPAPPPVSLSGATSFSGFVNQELPRYFNASTVDRLRTYDNDFSAFSDTTMLLGPNGESPLFYSISGLVPGFSVAAAPGQGIENEWPTYNALIELTATGNPRIFAYQARDLTNGLVGEGEARLYWGIKNIDYTQSPNVPIVFLFEQIVRQNGIPLYRAIGIIEGFLLTPVTPTPTGNPLVGIRGRYGLFVVEAFNGGATGNLLDYRVCLEKGGWSQAGYQPEGDWCR